MDVRSLFFLFVLLVLTSFLLSYVLSFSFLSPFALLSFLDLFSFVILLSFSFLPLSCVTPLPFPDLVDYSEHFAMNLPAGAFATHWQLFVFLSNNDPQKLKDLLQVKERD